MSTLKVENLTKEYGDVTAVDGTLGERLRDAF